MLIIAIFTNIERSESNYAFGSFFLYELFVGYFIQGILKKFGVYRC